MLNQKIFTLNILCREVRKIIVFEQNTILTSPLEPTSEPIYKIGDLGLLNEADNSKVYMEGDSRYHFLSFKINKRSGLSSVSHYYYL